MGVLLCISGYYIHANQPELVLLSFCSFVVIYQATQGSCMYIYVAEIVVNEVAMGLSLLCMMLSMTVQSLFSTYLINGKLGLDVVFYGLGIFQMIPVVYFWFNLKETQGLTIEMKKKLYLKKSKNKKSVKNGLIAKEKAL